jgi:hypothetical protein
VNGRRWGFAVPGSEESVLVDVEVGDPRVHDVVAAFFPDLQVHGTSGGSAPDLRLGGRDGSWELHRRDGEVWRAPDHPSILSRLEVTLAEALVRSSPGIPIHAAGVVTPAGRAVLLGGPGGSGKSSLTVALALRGARVLGDDVVLLREDRAHPFPRLLKLEEPARTILDVPRPTDSLSRTWPQVTFYHPRQLGTTWARGTPVGAVLLPRRVPDAPVELAERRPAEILPALLAELLHGPRVASDAFDAVVDVLGEVRCWELRYWDTPAAAEALVEILGWEG